MNDPTDQIHPNPVPVWDFLGGYWIIFRQSRFSDLCKPFRKIRGDSKIVSGAWKPAVDFSSTVVLSTAKDVCC